MNNKVEISFLNDVQDSIHKSLSIVDAVKSDSKSVKIIHNMLESLDKAHREILKSATADENGLQYVGEESVPEILWLRITSASIIKKSLENTDLIPKELINKMDKFFHHFDGFYETWVSNN